MIDYVDIYKRIQKYGVTMEDDMPVAYRKSGRPLHDDWIAFKSTPRMKTAYKIPFPFKKIDGNQVSRWVPLQQGYPLAPGCETRLMDYWDGEKTVTIPHIEIYEEVAKIGQWSVQAAWIDDSWRPCYFTSSRRIFGKRFMQYRGLKPDTTLGDFMAWFPEASFSYMSITPDMI